MFLPNEDAMLSVETIQKQFQDQYGRAPEIFSAPGRVNLIGEHTDYNDGFVLPMAIDRRTYIAAAPRDDGRVRASSTAFEGEVEFELRPDIAPAKDWADYIRGVAVQLLRERFTLKGADLLVASDVPVGGGLSSSAALEISSGYALLRLAGQPVDLIGLARLSQRAEQEFVGTQVGIMDQYISCLGIEGHALLIDCRSLEYRAVPIDLRQSRIVICNSMIRHELATGEYNKRRAECEEGVRRLRSHLPDIESLRDVELEAFDLYADTLPELIRRRCNHVITENARTLAAVQALEKDDLELFGRLMVASHQSLKSDYEVSSPELDLLVDLARKIPGVYGARMTGGGFGGCTVNLVAADATDRFIESIYRDYEKLSGLQSEIHVCLATGGAHKEV
jgi:galactokinase